MIRWMAGHPVAANLLMIILLVWGGMSTLNIRQIPKLDPLVPVHLTNQRVGVGSALGDPVTNFVNLHRAVFP